MNARLRAYLALERAMRDLDAASDPLADVIRDRMDEVWYSLSDADRARLDRRLGPPALFGGRVPVVVEPADFAGPPQLVPMFEVVGG